MELLRQLKSIGELLLTPGLQANEPLDPMTYSGFLTTLYKMHLDPMEYVTCRLLDVG